jgi:hypothetical protein
MKPLKTEFKKNSYIHTVLWRDENYAITELKDEDTGKVACYESFEIIKNKARTTSIMTTEAFESTPSNEQWGMKGLTSHSFEDAKLKINKLKSKKKQNG